MDNNLIHSFYYIAKHYLTQKVKIIIEQHPYSSVQGIMESDIQQVEKELLVTQREQTLLSVTAIQKYCETSIKSIFPELKNGYIMKIVKNTVKQVIRSIIQEELNSKYRLLSLKKQNSLRFQYKQYYLQEQNRQKHIFFKNVPANQNTEYKVKAQHIFKASHYQVQRQQSNVLQFQSDFYFRQKGTDQYNRKESLSFKQQIILNRTSNSYKQLYKLCQIDCRDQTEIYGHFLYGDKPEEIIDMFPLLDQIYVIISWKPRENEFLPQPSSLSVQTVRIYAPLLLTQYYERFLEEQNQCQELQNIKQEQMQISQ